MRGSVKAAVALRVEETRVGAALDEQVDDVGKALERGLLEGRGEERAGDRVDVRTVVDEVFARLGFAAYRGPVQRRDVVFVAVVRACTTRLDQGSDAFALS